MPDWGLWDGQRFETNADTAASGGTAVTMVNNNGAKAGWTTLIASTAFEASWLTLLVGANAAITRHLIDIGIGAASSEFALIENIHIGHQSAGPTCVLQMPVSIPAGTRISCRGVVALASGTNTIRVQAILGAGGWRTPAPLGRCTTWGASLVDSGGTEIGTANTTANTKGAYTQIVASTDHDVKWLCVGFGHNAVTIAASIHWLVDIAVGALAAENNIVQNLWAYMSGGADTIQHPYVCMPVNIPAGSRISARHQASVSNATATDPPLDIVLHGIG